MGRVLAISDGEYLRGPIVRRRFAWLRNGVVISGAENGTRTPVPADEGTMLIGRQWVAGPDGVELQIDTAAIGPIAPAAAGPLPGVAPSIVSSPLLTGAGPQEGFVTAASTGIYAGTAPIAIARQWQRRLAPGAWQDIAGAAALAYAPGNGDVGYTLRLREIATNDLGSVTAYTAESAAVVGVASGVPVAAMPAGATVLGRWSANHSAVTIDGDSRVTLATSTAGAADSLRGSSATAGPLQMIDALSRKLWRSDTNVLQERTLATSTRKTIIIVGRRLGLGSSQQALAGIGYSAADGGAPVNTIAGLLQYTSTGTARRYQTTNANPTDANAVIAGHEMHVIGATGSGAGSHFYYNGHATGGGNASNYTGVGLEIGRYPNTGTSCRFDYYEVIYLEPLSPADLKIACDNLMVAYGILPTANQILLEGDSKTAGWDSVGLGMTAADRLGEPGGPAALPGGWRISSTAVSGGLVSGVRSRRDQAAGHSGMLTAGRNVLSCEVGINGTEALGDDPALVVPATAAVLNTETTGYLQRGWECIQHTLMATGNATTYPGKVVPIRAGLQDPAFLTACNAAPGQTFDGKVKVYPLHLWDVGGGVTPFNLRTDVNLTWYQDDGLHPNTAGTLEYAKAICAAVAA